LLDQHRLLYSSSFGLLYVLCQNKHISSLLRKWGESNYLVKTRFRVKLSVPGRESGVCGSSNRWSKHRGFLSAHAAVYNLFNPGRHLVSAETYRYFQLRAFNSWEKAVAM